MAKVYGGVSEASGAALVISMTEPQGDVASMATMPAAAITSGTSVMNDQPDKQGKATPGEVQLLARIKLVCL
jgi:hypothetical protein